MKRSNYLTLSRTISESLNISKLILLAKVVGLKILHSSLNFVTTEHELIPKISDRLSKTQCKGARMEPTPISGGTGRVRSVLTGIWKPYPHMHMLRRLAQLCPIAYPYCTDV